MSTRRVDCCRCGSPIWMLEGDYSSLLRSHKPFHCLFGHSQSFTEDQGIEGQLAAMKRERDRLALKVAEKDDEVRAERERTRKAREKADHNQRSANAYKGVATKLKKCAVAGVCPCCKRHFRELERHMASQHPAYIAEPVVRREDEVMQ